MPNELNLGFRRDFAVGENREVRQVSIQESSHCKPELSAAKKNRLMSLHRRPVIFNLQGLNDQTLKIGVQYEG